MGGGLLTERELSTLPCQWDKELENRGADQWDEEGHLKTVLQEEVEIKIFAVCNLVAQMPLTFFGRGISLPRIARVRRV